MDNESLRQHLISRITVLLGHRLGVSGSDRQLLNALRAYAGEMTSADLDKLQTHMANRGERTMGKKKETTAHKGHHDDKGLIVLPTSLDADFWRKLGTAVLKPSEDWTLTAHLGLTVGGFILAQVDQHATMGATEDDDQVFFTTKELSEKCKEFADEIDTEHQPKGFTIQPWMIQLALMGVEYFKRWLQDRITW